MGRAYSTPEVMEAEGGFYISRIANPDDEFATTEMMLWLPVDTDTEVLGWVEMSEIPYGQVAMFNRRSEAERALAFYRFGQESVSARVVYE